MLKSRFIAYLTHEKRYSPHTLQAYETELDNFLVFVETEGLRMEDVDHKFARYYFAKMKEQGKAATSINRSISALKSYYKFLQREKFIETNPLRLIQSLKTPKKLPVAVDKDKMDLLLDSMADAEDSFENIRDFIVMELLFGTGVRVAELLQIKDADLDFYNNKILIFGKRNKERFVPIHATLKEELKTYLHRKRTEDLENISEYLVVTKEGKKAYAKLIYRIVQKYLSMVTSQKKRSPHVLRHSFATALLDNGADLNAIKELLGHAGLAATQVYTHNSAERLKSIYKQAHPRA